MGVKIPLSAPLLFANTRRWSNNKTQGFQIEPSGLNVVGVQSDKRTILLEFRSTLRTGGRVFPGPFFLHRELTRSQALGALQTRKFISSSHYFNSSCIQSSPLNSDLPHKISDSPTKPSSETKRSSDYNWKSRNLTDPHLVVCLRFVATEFWSEIESVKERKRMKNKRKLLAVFIGLCALALFGLIRVGSTIDRNLKMQGRKVAVLPSRAYGCRWLTNEKLLIQVPSYLYMQGRNNYPVRYQILNIKDGSLDQLAGLNNWVNGRESGAGTLLNNEPNAISPDGKWLYASEVKLIGNRSWTGTNLHWLLRLDGRKQISIKTQEGFVKWLPDSIGFISTHYLGVGQAGKNKFSHYILKLDALNKHLPIPGVFHDETIETDSALVGSQIVDLIADYQPIDKQSVLKIDSVHVVKRNLETSAVESTGPKVPLPPHSEKSYAAACILSPIGNRILWTFQENFSIAKSNILAEMFRRPNPSVFVITDLDGKVVRTLPPLETPANVRWLPDGKRVSYSSNNAIFIIDLD